MDLNNTLKLHLESMMNKNYDDFMTTISNDNISLIMPNGNLLTDIDGFKELHKEWFKDNDWSIDYRVIKVDETNDMGYAVVDIKYKDIDENSKPFEMSYYLNLVFKKVEDKWLLVHDQNTIYK